MRSAFDLNLNLWDVLGRQAEPFLTWRNVYHTAIYRVNKKPWWIGKARRVEIT